ncbi:hypothetical protein [Streptomyces sp. VN1]|uniref:PASTA domain-containing protein n=1 Tax=Streptomyces sp. VN1 TaxID=1821625 RepID=UPI001E3C2173|nr:hypothetical protein [Streptomyces sp. VN1]
MPRRIRTHGGTGGGRGGGAGGRGPGGAVALLAVCVLALAGCGGGDGGDPPADAGLLTAPATATATSTATPSDSPTPEASPSTEPPAPATLPDLTGRSVGAAVLAAEKADVDYTVRLQGTGRQASSWGSGEKVCEQSGGPGTATFTVPRDGRDCDGRLLHTPKPTPKPSKTRESGTGGTSGGTSGGTTGSGACELMSPAGNCYADGQFCAKKHRGLSTHGRGGEYLTCRQDSGGVWRWSDGVPG